jgi:hypothetical protein
VDNRLSAMLLDGRLRPGQHVTVDADGNGLVFQAGDRAEAAGAPGAPGAAPSG